MEHVADCGPPVFFWSAVNGKCYGCHSKVVLRGRTPSQGRAAGRQPRRCRHERCKPGHGVGLVRNP